MITSSKDKSLAYVVDRYIPQHIKDEYPLYYDFIETYYEYLSQNDEWTAYNIKKNLQNWTDVDTTLDDFINYFKDEYINLPFDDDWGLYMKHYKEIYASKGTTKSLQFFLRLLTGLNVNITYPNRDLMKSSDGVYRSYKIIYCERNNDINYNDYISTRATGGISEATGIIEKVEIYNNYVKIYLSNNKGTFTSEPVIFNNGVQFISNTVKVLSSVNIIEGGNNYSLDDVISVENYPELKLSLNLISSGTIDNVIITNGGGGYNVGDILTFACDKLDEYYAFPYIRVNEVDVNGSILNIKIHYKGYGFLEVPRITGVDTVSGSGAEFEVISKDSGSMKHIQILFPICSDDLDNPNIIVNSSTGYGAVLEGQVGYEVYENPYYYKNGSFLSDLFKLQDSYYWQEYSYVLDVTGSVLEKYKEVFKSILHPSGFIFFTNAILESYIELHKTYITSLIELDVSNDLNRGAIQFLPLLHYSDRLITTEILQPYRKHRLSRYENDELEDFDNIGGKYIESSLEINNT